MSTIIPGIQLLRQTGVLNRPDHTGAATMPYLLKVALRPPSFMAVTFVMLYGGREEIVVRGVTREALESFVALNDMRRHPRLVSLTITGPDDVNEEAAP